MVILFMISPHFGSLSVSLAAEPHSILTTTNLTAQNMSQCKLSWGKKWLSRRRHDPSRVLASV